MTLEKCGFIGLGIMGSPMAANLIKAGSEVYVHDVNLEAAKRLTALGAIGAEPADIAAACGIVFLSLPEGRIVKEILFDEHGLAESLGAGSVVVDLSSVTPAESLYCAERLKERQISFIDAPVSGGEPGAIDGTLAFMAGGDAASFERVRPYLDIMGRSAVLVGSNGSGSLAKLTNQVIVNMTIAAVSEAFVLAEKSGVAVDSVYQAIRYGLAGSAVLDAKLPMIMERDFRPGGKISINLKDIKNVMSTAHDLDVPMPFTSQLLEVMQSLKVRGLSGDDHCGIVKYFEKLADIEVSRKGPVQS